MADICSDNRFEIIAAAKKDLLESTNISGSVDEMIVLDNILFRCWQMGWLEQYNKKPSIFAKLERKKRKDADAKYSDYPCSDYLHNALYFIQYDKSSVAYEEICHALIRSGDALTENEKLIFTTLREERKTKQ